VVGGGVVLKFYLYICLSIYLRSGSEDSGVGGGLEIKVCPRCSVLIVKMDDGK